MCSFWTDDIKSSKLATSAGPPPRPIPFRSMVFLLQLKIENVVYIKWCNFTFGTAVTKMATNPTQIRVQQGAVSISAVPIGHVQFVKAFVLPLLFLVELCLVPCCLCLAEYGSCVVLRFRVHFCNLCDLFALYCWCVVSGSLKVSSIVYLMGRKRLNRLFCDKNGGSDNSRPEIAALTFQ